MKSLTREENTSWWKGYAAGCVVMFAFVLAFEWALKVMAAE